MISLTVSVTAVVRMLVSAQGWELSLACLSALIAWKVATLLLISITERSIPTEQSAMNCSQTALSRLSTSFLESRRCSWMAGVEWRMNSSRALLLLSDKMSDLS